MILVLGFKSSNNLAAVYGIAVTGDMVITSILATVVVVARLGLGLGRSARCFPCFLAVGVGRSPPTSSRYPMGGLVSLVAGIGVFIPGPGAGPPAALRPPPRASV